MKERKPSLASKGDYHAAMVTRVKTYQAMNRYIELRTELKPIMQTWGADIDFFERAYADAKMKQKDDSQKSVSLENFSPEITLIFSASLNLIPKRKSISSI